jgi:hypothetical protein
MADSSVMKGQGDREPITTWMNGMMVMANDQQVDVQKNADG